MGGYLPEPDEWMQPQREPEAILPQPQQPISRQQQVAAAYQQSQQEIQQAQSVAATREEDLNVAQYMTKMLDPTVPKAARQFLFRELSTRMGVDPKGETSQNFGKMLLGLEPEALERLNRGYADRIKNATPGQIKQMTQAVLQGDVSGIELMKMANVRVAQAGGGGTPGVIPAQPTAPISGPPGALPPAPGTTPPAADPAAAAGGPPSPSTRRYKGQGETIPFHQPVEPGLVRALGYQFGDPVRVSDLAKEGITVPQTPKEQNDLMKAMDANASATVTVVKDATRLHQLFKGKPEVLGLVGATARTVDQAIDQMKGVIRSAGGDTSTFDQNDKGFRALIARSAQRVSDVYKSSGIEQTAVDSARLQGAVLDMAYSMANAKGIPDNRLTNRMIAQELNTLGQSQSVAQFEATLKEAVGRALSKSSNEIAARVGRPMDPNLGFVNTQDLVFMGQSDIASPELKKTILEESKRRLSGAAGKPIKRAEPTVESEQLYTSEEERRESERKKSEEKRQQEEHVLKKRRDVRAEEEGERAEARMARTEFEQNRRFNLAEKRERRMEEQHRRDKIGAAFKELGKMIGEAGSSGRSIGAGIGAGGGGGDQDAGAFRMTPAPRRAPPKPVDAERYQRKPGK